MRKLIVIGLLVNAALLAGRLWQHMEATADQCAPLLVNPTGKAPDVVIQDMNGDERYDAITEAVTLLRWHFLGGEAPVRPCLALSCEPPLGELCDELNELKVRVGELEAQSSWRSFQPDPRRIRSFYADREVSFPSIVEGWQEVGPFSLHAVPEGKGFVVTDVYVGWVSSFGLFPAQGPLNPMVFVLSDGSGLSRTMDSETLSFRQGAFFSGGDTISLSVFVLVDFPQQGTIGVVACGYEVDTDPAASRAGVFAAPEDLVTRADYVQLTVKGATGSVTLLEVPSDKTFVLTEARCVCPGRSHGGPEPFYYDARLEEIVAGWVGPSTKVLLSRDLYGAQSWRKGEPVTEMNRTWRLSARSGIPFPPGSAVRFSVALVHGVSFQRAGVGIAIAGYFVSRVSP